MKNNIIYLLVGVMLTAMASCDRWLSQQDPDALSSEQAYSSVSGINSVVANLYSRLYLPQDFTTDNNSYDLTRWDEATNNSPYWSFAANAGDDYRNYYDYGLVRDINKHLKMLAGVGSEITDEQKDYFIAEGRFLRALVYFKMVENLGGVPIVDTVYPYTNNPKADALPRNTEAQVYDFIATEIDRSADDLNLYIGKGGATKTRATEGAALALECRAMLYAGTLALNYDRSAAKGLNLPSGATGIPSDKADGYFQRCLDAFDKLRGLGEYSLYEKDPDLSENFYKAFTDKMNNPELILYKDYDGSTDYPNYFTQRAIARSQRSVANSGSQINPTLNLVDCFEMVQTHTITPFNPYVGDDEIENMGDVSSSYVYRVFDDPADIFAGRDPRLAGTVLFPGSKFRGKDLQFQAGLAVKTAGGYEFKSAPTIEQATDANAGYYNGVQMTGIDGPHRTSYYVSHSGFLLRKFTDATAGSESAGASTIPYVMFRYGEVLLDAAEAAFYLGDKQQALDLINEIRARAGGPDFTLSMAELSLDQIKNERRVELAFENKRFYDLKRWRTADEVWSGDRNSASANMFGLWPYKIYAPGDPNDGKWIYRKVRLEHRGSANDMGQPIKFSLAMYYPTYPTSAGNPLIEQNPHH